MDNLGKISLKVGSHTEGGRIGLLKLRILVLQRLELVEKTVILSVGYRGTGLYVIFILIPAEQV